MCGPSDTYNNVIFAPIKYNKVSVFTNKSHSNKAEKILYLKDAIHYKQLTSWSSANTSSCFV